MNLRDFLLPAGLAALAAAVAISQNTTTTTTPAAAAPTTTIATAQPEPTSDQLLADIAVIVNYDNLCGNVPEWQLLPAIRQFAIKVMRATPPDTFRAAFMKAKPHPNTMGYCADTTPFVQNFTRNFFRGNPK